jgi:hypothetical protein
VPQALAPAPVPVERLGAAPSAAAPAARWRTRDLLRALRVDAAGLGRRSALVVGLAALGALAGLGLAAASAWLVLRAAEHPGVQALAVATVAVRTCALSKALLRYAERLAAHDVALRLLARTRTRVVEALVPLAPHGLGLWRRGDVLRRFTSDVDAVQDAVVRGLFPVASAAVSGLAALVVTAWLAPACRAGAGVRAALTALCAPLAAWAGRRGLGAGPPPSRGVGTGRRWPGSSRPRSCGCTAPRTRRRPGPGAGRAGRPLHPAAAVDRLSRHRRRAGHGCADADRGACGLRRGRRADHCGRRHPDPVVAVEPVAGWPRRGRPSPRPGSGPAGSPRCWPLRSPCRSPPSRPPRRRVPARWWPSRRCSATSGERRSSTTCRCTSDRGRARRRGRERFGQVDRS